MTRVCSTNTFTQMPFTVENPNYYDLNLQSLNLEIDYESVYIGNLVQNSTVDFYKQATTVKQLKKQQNEYTNSIVGAYTSNNINYF